MVSRAYYACAFAAVVIFWIPVWFVIFVAESRSSGSSAIESLIYIVGLLLPFVAIPSAYASYYGLRKGRFSLIVCALLGGAYTYLLFEFRLQSGDCVWRGGPPEPVAMLLITMAAAHTALIMRGRAEMPDVKNDTRMDPEELEW